MLSCVYNEQVMHPQNFNVHQDGDMWYTELEPQQAGTQCDLGVTVGSESIELVDIIFGDVWVCSGQSNMVFKMKQIFNATEEMEDAARYMDIRFTTITLATSAEELDDVTPTFPWSNPSDGLNLQQMSAVCFLTAKHIYDNTGIPQGLINSCVGGTRVEAWSRQVALQACGIPDNVDEDRPQNSNSNLWNAMIAPLKRMTVFGFLWYQGEANAGWNRDLYSCSFPQLISDWRTVFAENSNTNVMAPFGFVQLSTIQFGNQGLSYPIMRQHQLADMGSVPNEKMPNTFMAVSVDTYDEENGIHPRYKAIVAERLATTGMNVAYNDDRFPSSGPQIKNVSNEREEGWTFTFTEDFFYNEAAEISGFYYCCDTDPEQCKTDLNAASWPEVPKDFVRQVDVDIMFISNAAFTVCTSAELTGTFFDMHNLDLETYIEYQGYCSDPMVLWTD